MTISDLTNEVLQSLEEDPAAPIFWNLVDEVRPAVVEAARWATIITGESELRVTPAAPLAADTMLFSVPSSLIALIRMEATAVVPKSSPWKLDRMIPGWQNEMGDELKAWFPVGLTKFGIYPRLNNPVQVVLTGIALPVTTARPYTGLETLPFQIEYEHAMQRMAVHLLRIKEGGLEFYQSLEDLDSFLEAMVDLGRFSYRKDKLRFTSAFGPKAEVKPVETR
jgi:hypothetical protein